MKALVWIRLFLALNWLDKSVGQFKIVQPFPKNIYTEEGANASVTCIAEDGLDEVQFVRKNEEGKFTELFNTSRVYTTSKLEGNQTIFTLHFKTISIADDSTLGRYECWAHKPGDNTDQWDDSAKHGFNVQVIRRSLGIVRPFPRNICALEGKSASVTCIAEGGPDKVQFVRRNDFGTFAKLANTSRVHTTSKIEGVQIVFTLHFKTISISDDSALRRYECWAHKPGDNTDQWLNSEKHGFSVNVIKRSSLPKISPNGSVILNVKLGSSLELVCNVTVSKQTFDIRGEAVHWLKDNEIIATAYAYRGDFQRTLKPLLLNKISSQDGGNYTCFVETKIRSTKPLNITGGTYIVNVKVEMTKGDQEIHAIEGSNVTLECSAEGYPLAVVWKMVQKGREVDIERLPNLSPHVTFWQDLSSWHYKMGIHNVTRNFSGKYLCRTANSVDSGRQQFTLLVKDYFVSSSIRPTLGYSAALVFLYHIL